VDIFVKGGSIYVKPRPKWTHIVVQHFTSSNALFVNSDNL